MLSLRFFLLSFYTTINPGQDNHLLEIQGAKILPALTLRLKRPFPHDNFSQNLITKFGLFLNDESIYISLFI